MSEELKACPFCGKNSAEYANDDNDWVYCSNWLCKFYRLQVRFEMWQSRPIEDSLRTELESMRALNIKDTNSVLWKIAEIQKERDALQKEVDKLKIWLSDTDFDRNGMGLEIHNLRAKLELATKSINDALDEIMQYENDHPYHKNINQAHIYLGIALQKLEE